MVDAVRDVKIALAVQSQSLAVQRGFKSYGRHLDTLARSRFRNEYRKRFRRAANILRDRARRNAKAQLPGGTGRLARSIKTSIRFRRGRITAAVGPKRGRKQYAYGHVHEFGGTRERRASRRSGRRAHSATYDAQPYLEPAVVQTQEPVFREIGFSFRVL